MYVTPPSPGGFVGVKFLWTSALIRAIKSVESLGVTGFEASLGTHDMFNGGTLLVGVTLGRLCTSSDGDLGGDSRGSY